MSKKKKLDIGNIVNIFEEVQGCPRCTGVGVILSKTFGGVEYRVKNLATLRENWYESKDLEDVTKVYPNLLTNCCLKRVDRESTIYYKITGVKIEKDDIYLWCDYDHFWHNIKYLERERFTLV